jgi:hypothetical protein
VHSDVIPFEPLKDRRESEERKPETESEAVSRPSSKSERRSKRKHPAGDTELIREIRAAMKDLQRGKSVSAYQRLERAIADR